MHILANDVCTAWTRLLTAVMDLGKTCRPRGKEIRELLHTQVVVTNARNNVLLHPVRDLNFRFMIAEWLWIQSGREDVAWIEKFNKQITQFSDDGKVFRGAYGPRFRKQIQTIIDLFKSDPDTRQAVVRIFDGSDLVGQTKDVPCTLSLQLLLREGRLHGIMTMRSNDLWLGFPYDFFNFSMITNSIAGEIGAKVGSFTLQCGSSHVYATDFDKVQSVLNPPSGVVESAWMPSPQLNRLAPQYVPDAAYDVTAEQTGETLCVNLPLDTIETAYVHALKCPTKATALQVLKTL